MAKTISIHSFRGGTGKSHITANVATAAALRGRRVAVIDTDIQSPGVHGLVGRTGTEFEFALNDYLWERCTIEQTAHDVTPGPVRELGGAVHLIPSSLSPGEIARVLREGYDVGRLIDGIRASRAIPRPRSARDLSHSFENRSVALSQQPTPQRHTQLASFFFLSAISSAPERTRARGPVGTTPRSANAFL